MNWRRWNPHLIIPLGIALIGFIGITAAQRKAATKVVPLGMDIATLITLFILVFATLFVVITEERINFKDIPPKLKNEKK